MPSEYVVLPSRHLVFIRHRDRTTYADAFQSFETWTNDPDFDPSHSWLMDFEPLTDFDEDPVAMMELQAQLLEATPPSMNPPLFVIHAPPGNPGAPMALMVHRAWDGLDLRLPRIAPTQSEALDILGMPERSFSELLAAEAAQFAPS